MIELFESSSCVKASGSGIRDLFVRLFGDYIANDSLTIPSMTAGIHQILITICRSCRHVHRQSYFTNETGKKRLFLDMVNYIDNNCRKMDALQSLSKQFGYSYSTLSELFTKMMGQTLKEYYTEQRFARAATCLTDGMRVTEVACYLGYRSIHSFSRAFSQHFSISPREYQKNPANAVIKKEK
ncbi:MAG TPA: hypothetical protein DER23_10300 [Clostridiales bacterium]|nr:hypothetical protein [Clostridiales bacterium]